MRGFSSSAAEASVRSRNHRDLEIEAQAAGFERGAQIRRDGRFDHDRILVLVKWDLRCGAHAIAVASRRRARRSDRREWASPSRRNGRAIDACARSAASAPAAHGRRRARDFFHRVCAGWPPGSTFIHQPRVASSRPSGRSIRPSSGSGEPSTMARYVLPILPCLNRRPSFSSALW